MKNISNPERERFGWLRRVFIRLSGTAPAEVESLSAGTQFTCCVVGLTIFVPVICFVTGASRAAIAQHGYVPLGDAVFIGSFSVIILVVDWAIITTIRATGSILRTVLLAAFRLGLAAVMAWNISQPLLIARFNDHINIELANRRERKIGTLRENARAREAEIIAATTPGVAASEKAVANIEAAQQFLAGERQQAERELAKAREEYSREITGMNPSGVPKEGPIGRKLRENIMEPAEARLKKLDLRDEELQSERAKLNERMRVLRESALASPQLAEIKKEVAAELSAMNSAPSPGLALRAQILADLWHNNADLRRDVWLFLLWLVLLDVTPVWAKILAPIRSLDRARARRDFRERTDAAVDEEVYPSLARDVVQVQNEEFLFVKQLESELAKQGHCLRGALATVEALVEARRHGTEHVTEAYGADAIHSPEAQESLAVVEAACSSVADSYTAFLTRSNTEVPA